MELTNEIYAFDNGLKGEAGACGSFALREAIEALVKMMTPFTPHRRRRVVAVSWA
jgi:leucyl-tRNA synthetase